MRQAKVTPDWLDKMLQGWGKASIRQRGWYTKSPMLSDGMKSTPGSREPIGLVKEDWSDLQRAIDTLNQEYLAAINRTYKPWLAKEIDAVWNSTPVTWHRRLQTAAMRIVVEMKHEH